MGSWLSACCSIKPSLKRSPAWNETSHKPCFAKDLCTALWFQSGLKGLYCTPSGRLWQHLQDAYQHRIFSFSVARPYKIFLTEAMDVKANPIAPHQAMTRFSWKTIFDFSQPTSKNRLAMPSQEAIGGLHNLQNSHHMQKQKIRKEREVTSVRNMRSRRPHLKKSRSLFSGSQSFAVLKIGLRSGLQLR